MKTNSKTTINKKSLIAGFSGNILEWYDFTVYGFFATVIGTQFFPESDKVVQLISSFGVFAAGYLVRPLGGVIFGLIGDKQGRKKALAFSVIMMAVSTTLIAFLPVYANIGWYSALLLILLRLLQGFSVGGEFTGAISFLVETAPEGKRGFYGSWTTFGVFGGILLGSGIATLITSILTKEQLHDFGWRIPFLMGVVIGFVGYFLRKSMNDDYYEEIKKEKQIVKNPLLTFWKEYRMQAVRLILISWAFGVSVYLLFIFLPSYLHTFLGVKLSNALSAHTITIAVLMLIIPFFGYLTDKIGRKALLLGALTGFIVFTYPLFALMFKNTYLAILAAMLAFAIFEAMFQAVMPVMMTEMFPAHVRYTGLSVSYNISLALFGGTAPVFSTWLVKVSGGNVWMPAYYLIFTCIIALITVFFIPETYQKKLD
jgi:MHS family proline/betaine transporter-like MFS transporter